MEAQSPRYTVDLYFPRMERPVRVCLGHEHLRELENISESCTAIDGVVLYRHPHISSACAAHRYPRRQRLLAPTLARLERALLCAEDVVSAR